MQDANNALEPLLTWACDLNEPEAGWHAPNSLAFEMSMEYVKAVNIVARQNREQKTLILLNLAFVARGFLKASTLGWADGSKSAGGSSQVTSRTPIEYYEFWRALIHLARAIWLSVSASHLERDPHYTDCWLQALDDNDREISEDVHCILQEAQGDTDGHGSPTGPSANALPPSDAISAAVPGTSSTTPLPPVTSTPLASFIPNAKPVLDNLDAGNSSPAGTQNGGAPSQSSSTSSLPPNAPPGELHTAVSRHPSVAGLSTLAPPLSSPATPSRISPERAVPNLTAGMPEEHNATPPDSALVIQHSASASSETRGATSIADAAISHPNPSGIVTDPVVHTATGLTSESQPGSTAASVAPRPPPPEPRQTRRSKRKAEELEIQNVSESRKMQLRPSKRTPVSAADTAKPSKKRKAADTNTMTPKGSGTVASGSKSVLISC